MTQLYEGRRHDDGTCEVLADGAALALYLGVHSHSPTGFEWGYGGSGPAQLALAVACDALEVPADATAGDNPPANLARALAVYQRLKARLFSMAPRAGWAFRRNEVLAEIAAIEALR